MRTERRFAERIDETGQALAQALGSRAVAVVLYGSAAGEDFSPEHSDVNLLVVLREVAFQDLRLIGSTLERESSRQGVRFATPLVVRAEFLRAARDSFPIELEDIRTRHRILAGADMLSDLSVAPASVRLAAEREVRTMLLRVHALAMHRPDDVAVRDALSHLYSSFAVVGAALLELARGVGRPRGAALLAAIADRVGVELPGFREVHESREGARPWPAQQELDRLLDAILRELHAVVAKLDAPHA
jgi:hypothetical protein